MNNIAATSSIKATREEDSVVLHWGDGEETSFSHNWLKENAPENHHPLTGKKLASFADRQDEFSPWSVCIEYDETLVISWAGMREVSRFSLDELRGAYLIADSPELVLLAD